MSKGNEIRDLLVLIVVVSLILAAIIYGWMAFFVLLLKYDYVTSSSILFTVFLVSALMSNLAYFFRLVADREVAETLGVLLGVLLIMASLTAGLSVFTSLHHPVISNRFDMVAAFWNTAGLPFVLAARMAGDLLVAGLTFAAKGFPVLRDGLKAVLGFIDQSPTFSNALGSLLSMMLGGLLFRSRLLPAPAS